MTYDEAMSAIRGPGTWGARVSRPDLPWPIALRFGHPVFVTGPRSHIAYTPTAKDMAAVDWEVLGDQIPEARA